MKQSIADQLKLFPYKPDEALESPKLFCVLADFSPATFYRKGEKGEVPFGKLVGGQRKIKAGDIRKYLADPQGWTSKKSEKDAA